ncbi:hypothetical protein N7462_010179 [Penicillium macrosclerotiorum]|uniref:uncharacterized protein n=1 Tax=Penicillium macrosclerotiorum TaxID=303699 RepID=UPI0025483E14|nr:uncharacterized protein N7462_010179 [Penicillium macrosclerotiorum]KAJ5669109.1 hypothetical protein N7462_010179 [Penicillium macrosclerotiorum]
MGQSLSNLRRQRSASTLRNLAPRPTLPTQQPSLSIATLTSALHNVALHLHSRHNNLTSIVVGGVVNTLLIRSRSHTSDVDFFNDNLTANEIKILMQATKAAMKKDTSLGDQWLSNHTVLFIPLNLRRILTSQSVNQNEIVFRAPGLTILAAPWEYQLCTKLDRLSNSGKLNNTHPYDEEDALHYLARYLDRNSIDVLQKSKIQCWFRDYSLIWHLGTDEILQHINIVYRDRFSIHHNVIDLTN